MMEVALGIATVVIAFAGLVLKIVEVARKQ